MALESESWRTIAVELGVEVVSPFDVSLNGTRVTFTALLPQFGGPAGMVVDPDWSVIEPHADALFGAGYGYSCISVDGSTAAGMQHVLLDWTWNETTAKKPSWL